MQQENQTQDQVKIAVDAVYNFVTQEQAIPSLEFLEEWFLIAIQNYEYDDDVARIAAVNTYRVLKELITDIATIDTIDLRALKVS